MRGSQDDGQAEDLVSDVHLRAQNASQAAVAAGEEQQQKVGCPKPSTSACHKRLHVITSTVCTQHAVCC